MTEPFARHDVADYLKTRGYIAAYLEASAEVNDPAQMTLALGAGAGGEVRGGGIANGRATPVTAI